MKGNQLKLGVIISYATQAVQILSGLIYTPLMLRLLGQSEYGLYQLVYSVVSYLSLLSLGFGSSYIRFYSRYKVKNDNIEIACLNGMFLLVFSIIAFLCLVCGSVLCSNIETVLGQNLTIPELQKAKILMFILVVSMVFTFLNSVFVNYITAHEQFFFQKLVVFLSAILNPFITLPLLLMGYGSVAVVAVTAILSIASFIANVLFCFKKLSMEFLFKAINLTTFKEVWTFTIFVFISEIVSQINWNVDKFLLGRMLGTKSVAIYGVAAQLNTMYIAISASVSNVFTPRVNMLVANKHKNEELSELFSKVGRIQFIILALVLSVFILFGKPFINIWAGEGYDASYQIGLFLIVPVTVPLIQNVGIQIQMAKNMHKFRSVTYLFIALSNIFLSIWCIKHWGELGAAIGTAFSLFLGNGFLMNVYYHKKIGIDIKYFWKNIIKILPGIICSMFLGVIISRIFNTEKLIYLIIAIGIYFVIYIASMWFLSMNKYEKDLILKPILRIIDKKRGEIS